MDYSLPGSSVLGISQAQILERVAVPFCRWSSWPRDQTSASCVSCIAGRFFTAEPLGKPQMLYSVAKRKKNSSPALPRWKPTHPMQRSHSQEMKRVGSKEECGFWGVKEWTVLESKKLSFIRKSAGSMCICITESLCCISETNTTLLINYTPI